MIRRIRMTVAQLKKHMDNRFKTVERGMNRRFAAVDARFAGVDGRLDAIDARLDRTDARMAAGFESLDAKFDALFRLLKDKQDHHSKVVDDHEERLKDLERATGRQGA
jgi:chromosome segregation ATPase